MKYMGRLITLVMIIVMSVTEIYGATGKSYVMTSPDGALQLTVKPGEGSDGGVVYTISRDGRTVVTPSLINLDIEGVPAIRLTGAKTRRDITETIDAPLYRKHRVSVTYNQLDLRLTSGVALTFRIFNDGVAYRWSTSRKGVTTVIDETAQINFEDDPMAWLPYSTNEKKPEAMAFQALYDHTTLGNARNIPAFLPVTVDCGDGVKVTVTESDLEAYPGMFVNAGKGSLTGWMARYPSATDFYEGRRQEYVTATHDYIARSEGSRTYPWRILAITTDDRQLPANDLVYALASPNRIGDTSWIKSGKVAWDWWNDWNLSGVPFKAGINMDTYKHYIDFASDNGLEFVILDEGWYNPKSGDMLTVIPELDLEQLVAYGKERGVDIILWTVFNVLDSQLEEACRKYADMGIAGFKVDFLDRDDQTGVEMVYRIADACARHGLVLDLHGVYKPTGLSRTYPNVINYEAVFGMEEVKWTGSENNMPEYDVTFPFIRMMAGPVDYTPGAMRNATKADWRAVYDRPMSMGTRSHQIATYVVYDSPLTMLADAPSAYAKEQPTVDFITSLPTLADTMIVLSGKIGEYIVSARRHGATWALGGMTNWDARTASVDFSFLPDGRDYTAVVYSDGPNAAKNAEDYKIDTLVINRHTAIDIDMAPGGGFAIKLNPKARTSAKVGPVPAEKRAAIPAFYKKYVDSDGLYVVTSDAVSDEAISKACDIMDLMLIKRPDVKRHLVERGCHVLVIGKDEQTCDIPEYKHVCTDNADSIAFWNWRARGFGGPPEDDLSSGCGEENLLALPGDKYVGENILVHEFSHLIHLIGIAEIEPGFNDRLEALYQSAKTKGLWNDTYALSNKEEYFAEAVQSFFNCNRYQRPANGTHNWVNRRTKLKNYDPDMYALLTEYFYPLDLPLNNIIHK